VEGSRPPLAQGLRLEGLYRLSPARGQLEALRARLDAGAVADDEWARLDPLLCAAALKLFLRRLPHHLLTDELRPACEAVVAGAPPPLSAPLARNAAQTASPSPATSWRRWRRCWRACRPRTAPCSPTCSPTLAA